MATIGSRGGDLPHQRSLRAVTVAAAAEHHEQASLRARPDRGPPRAPTRARRACGRSRRGRRNGWPRRSRSKRPGTTHRRSKPGEHRLDREPDRQRRRGRSERVRDVEATDERAAYDAVLLASRRSTRSNTRPSRLEFDEMRVDIGGRSSIAYVATSTPAARARPAITLPASSSTPTAACVLNDPVEESRLGLEVRVERSGDSRGAHA